MNFREYLNENSVPQIIKDVGFDFDWDEKKVWKLNVPAEEMNINDLVWHFKVPFLGTYNLKPQEVIDNSDVYKEEYKRAMNSDISFPIDIMKNKGRWVILDGLHRLMKAYILNMKQVKVRKIDRKYISKII